MTEKLQKCSTCGAHWILHAPPHMEYDALMKHATEIESCWARSAPSYRSFLGFSSTCPLPPGKKLYPAIVLILDVLKTFCDFSVLSIPTETIHIDGCSFQMDLQFLSLTTEKYDLARRLCNSSDPSVNPYFPAQWWFYWKEFGEWRHYEESLSEQLNLAFELGAWTHAFETNGCLYCVCMKGLTQRNVKTGFSRDVRRRPIYRSYESMAPYLRTVMEKDPGTIPDYTGLYPPTWQMEPWTPDSTFLQVPLRRTEKEFIDIKSHFHQTMPKDLVLICRIYRIQNKFLWRKYTCQKELMSEGLNDAEKTSLERHLFHGTTRDVVEQICQQNFDPRLSGVHGTSYGKGSYFALEASYSHNYSRLSEKGYQNMFVAKVLIGKMALGDAKYSRPPKLPSSHALYDCCVDNLLNPKIFVVYDSCQCYPFFLIQYKLLSEPILVNE
ncbi:protein mono-ADP-ribosyltransferase TIPARP-like isoform X5 [Pleurodeles waltl]|uniref:protein mono-ADP-ribosyltransferase TIPARP-like isoform X5 n=1 Tax=Pleurodeles waltl TaxID=8319 RepID=UPI00370971DB